MNETLKYKQIQLYSLCDGEPKTPGMTGIGSDAGIGNAEICLANRSIPREESQKNR